MGTYQHYDFYSIDRPLTDEELSAVSNLSSRVEPTSRRATLTYHYSDFRHNEMEVLKIGEHGSWRLKYLPGLFRTTNYLPTDAVIAIMAHM